MITTQSSYETRFQGHLEATESFLEALLPLRDPQPLWGAMRHGVLQKAKRIRPVLLIETCLSCGGSLESALPTACALELIHCYSLIHDDLPCMDNDDLRRGVPTVHRAFSEDMAVLAGDALLAMAFGVIPAHNKTVSPVVLLQVLQNLSQAASIPGLVSGQADDILCSQSPPSEETLYRIHEGKTAALFAFATEAGALLAGREDNTVTQLKAFGHALGLAFQMVDDLLDVKTQASVLGKTPGKDQAQGKITFPAVFGLSETERILEAACEDMNAVLKHLPQDCQTEGLLFLIQYIKTRMF